MIGALTSAVLAALVAIMVVRVTNGHQKAIAARALEAQERAMEAQLSEQRSEASRERENAAIGLLVAAVKHGSHTYKQSVNREAVLTDMEAALARWMMEVEDYDIRLALSPWPSLLFNLFHEADASYGNDDDHSKAVGRMQEAVAGFTTYATVWPLSDSTARAHILERLSRLYTDVNDASLAYRIRLGTSRSDSQD